MRYVTGLSHPTFYQIAILPVFIRQRRKNNAQKIWENTNFMKTILRKLSEMVGKEENSELIEPYNFLNSMGQWSDVYQYLFVKLVQIFVALTL